LSEAIQVERVVVNALATPEIVYWQCMRSVERYILPLRQLTSSSEKPT